MATFWISFRIADGTVGGKTYETRYNAFIDQLRGYVGAFWEETTSFVVFDTNQSIATMTAGLKAAIAPSADLFLIRQINAESAYIFGPVKDQAIFALMPYLKKA